MKSENSKILIRSGTLIDPSQKLNEKKDLIIENGKVLGIEKPGGFSKDNGSNIKIIEADGCFVFPGMIDVHVHLREPGFEYRESIHSGSHVAIAGGVTSIACMANTNPVNDCREVTETILAEAARYGHCRVFPIGAVTKNLEGKELAQIGAMAKAGVCALSDDGVPLKNSQLMRTALEYAKGFNLPIITHAEDPDLSAHTSMHEGETSFKLGLPGNPSASEEIMVARDIALARLTGAHVHIAHVSTENAVKQIRRAKEEGVLITAEVCPHHLMFTDTDVCQYDINHKMAPPLRSEKDRVALMAGLKDGTIDILASDHAPHAPFEKNLPFEDSHCGVLGLQTLVTATYEFVKKDLISINRWVEALTLAPARLIGKPLGTLKVGSLADVTILNPKQSWTFDSKTNQSQSQNSPFMGHSFSSKITHTVVNGAILFDAGAESGRA